MPGVLPNFSEFEEQWTRALKLADHHDSRVLSMHATVSAIASDLVVDGATSGIADTHRATSNDAENMVYFVHEYDAIQKLESNYHAGQEMLAFLYSYRSVSRAIPQSQKQNQEIFEKSIVVLKPLVEQTTKLMNYCEGTVKLIEETVRNLLPLRKDLFFSDVFLLCLTRSLNLVVTIDAVRNMKTSLNNDCSAYKRAVTFLKTPNVEMETLTKLVWHLGSPDVMKQSLKTALQAIKGYEDVLLDLIQSAADAYDSKQYLLPETKHMLLKSIVFSLYLLDGTTDDNVKKKRLKMDRFNKLIKSLPVVPLFGDMPVTLTSLLKKCSFDIAKWDYSSQDETLLQTYSVAFALEKARADFTEQTLQLSALHLTIVDHKTIFDCCWKSLQLIAGWTCLVLEQSSWKYANPTNPSQNPNCPSDASSYEMGVRYNYSFADRHALIEMIYMIKSLSEILLKQAAHFQPALHSHIHTEVQQFIGGTIQDAVNHTVKKKRPIVSVLAHLRDSVADTSDSHQIDESVTTLSSNQAYLLRALIDASCSERAKGMKGGIIKEKDLKDSQVNEMMTFRAKLFSFQYMQDFEKSIRQASDLAQLWYKEFYLELLKQIQFPIETSLPWILTDHIISTKKDSAPVGQVQQNEESLIDCLLYPFDIYNDAAHMALYTLRCRYLYYEIEAEVNLCFDQFVFKLSQKVFSHAKDLTSCQMMNKEIRHQNNLDSESQVPAVDWTNILHVRDYQLLGRTIDIRRLMSQSGNQYIRKCIEVAIARFESTDFTGIIELDLLLRLTRQTHLYLNQHINLDPFDDVLAEVNEEVSLASYSGRIASHVLSEFINVVSTDYCYNSVTNRFIPSPLPRPVHRTAPVKAHAMHFFGNRQLAPAFLAYILFHRRFIGQQHFEAALRWLGLKHLGCIINEISKRNELIVREQLVSYMTTFASAYPKNIKQPLFEYGTKGCYEYYFALLSPFLNYRGLKEKVLPMFQQLGNNFILAWCLDHVMTQMKWSKALSSTDSAVFMKVASQSAPLILDDVKTSEQPPALFRYLLATMSPLLEEVRHEWEHPVQNEPGAPVPPSTEFHRIWSVLHFAAAVQPAVPTEYSVRELVGDGVHWAAAVFFYLMKQYERFATNDFCKHVSYTCAACNDKMASGVSAFIDQAESNEQLLEETMQLARGVYPV